MHRRLRSASGSDRERRAARECQLFGRGGNISNNDNNNNNNNNNNKAVRERTDLP